MGSCRSSRWGFCSGISPAEALCEPRAAMMLAELEMVGPDPGTVSVLDLTIPEARSLVHSFCGGFCRSFCLSGFKSGFHYLQLQEFQLTPHSGLGQL